MPAIFAALAGFAKTVATKQQKLVDEMRASGQRLGRVLGPITMVDAELTQQECRTSLRRHDAMMLAPRTETTPPKLAARARVGCLSLLACGMTGGALG